jgi:uncharacterized protein (DUF2164 family)
MAIELPAEAKKQALGSIKRYVAENFEQDIGELKAGLLLDYFLREIAPTVYNQAVADARKYFQARSGISRACASRRSSATGQRDRRRAAADRARSSEGDL